GAARHAGGFRLASESGRESIRWEVRARQDTPQGPALRCDVSLTGCYLGEGLADTPAAPDYLMVFRNFMVGLAAMSRLQSSLEAGLGMAEGEQAVHPVAIDCNLGSLFDQSLVLALGRRPDVLSGGLPIATLRFVAGRTVGETSFPAGPAALRELA